MKPSNYFQILLVLITMIPLDLLGQWKVYTEEIQTGLIKGGNNTLIVCEDQSGNIWGTSTKGDILQYKNDETWTLYSSERISLLAQTNVGEIANAKTGSRVDWVASLDNNKNWVWFSSNKNTMLWNGKELLAMTGHLDTDNRMIFYSDNEKKNYIIKDNQLIPYSSLDLVKPSKPIIQIYTNYIDDKNRLWLGHWKGELYCLDNGIWKVFDDIKNIKDRDDAPKGIYQINIIFEDKSGNVWFILNNCIIKYDGKNYTIEKEVKGAKSIFEDSKGNLWIGYVDGILKYNNGQWQQFSEKTNGLDKIYDAGPILEDDNGNIWFCSRLNIMSGKDGSLYKYTGSNWQAVTVDKKGKIFYLFKDSKGTLWCATAGAVYKYENNVWKNVRESENVMTVFMSIFEDSKGRMWFGTGSFKGRIERYTPE